MAKTPSNGYSIEKAGYFYPNIEGNKQITEKFCFYQKIRWGYPANLTDYCAVFERFGPSLPNYPLSPTDFQILHESLVVGNDGWMLRLSLASKLLHKIERFGRNAFAFDFDLCERVSRRSAERQAESGEKLFERSEFFSPRLNRALQGTPAYFAGAVKWRREFLPTFCSYKK